MDAFYGSGFFAGIQEGFKNAEDRQLDVQKRQMENESTRLKLDQDKRTVEAERQLSQVRPDEIDPNAGLSAGVQGAIAPNAQPTAAIPTSATPLPQPTVPVKGALKPMAAEKYFDPSLGHVGLGKAMMRVETGGVSGLTSDKGAEGLMQFDKITRKEMIRKHGIDPLSSDENNVKAGQIYLNDLSKRFGGDKDSTLAAYNMGPTALARLKAKYPDSWQQHLPRETREYLKKVHRYEDQAGGEGQQPSQAVQDEQRTQLADFHKAMALVNKAMPDAPQDVKVAEAQKQVEAQKQARESQEKGKDHGRQAFAAQAQQLADSANNPQPSPAQMVQSMQDPVKTLVPTQMQAAMNAQQQFLSQKTKQLQLAQKMGMPMDVVSKLEKDLAVGVKDYQAMQANAVLNQDQHNELVLRESGAVNDQGSYLAFRQHMQNNPYMQQAAQGLNFTEDYDQNKGNMQILNSRLQPYKERFTEKVDMMNAETAAKNAQTAAKNAGAKLDVIPTDIESKKAGTALKIAQAKKIQYDIDHPKTGKRTQAELIATQRNTVVGGAIEGVVNETLSFGAALDAGSRLSEFQGVKSKGTVFNTLVTNAAKGAQDDGSRTIMASLRGFAKNVMLLTNAGQIGGTAGLSKDMQASIESSLQGASGYSAAQTIGSLVIQAKRDVAANIASGIIQDPKMVKFQQEGVDKLDRLFPYSPAELTTMVSDKKAEIKKNQGRTISDNDAYGLVLDDMEKLKPGSFGTPSMMKDIREGMKLKGLTPQKSSEPATTKTAPKVGTVQSGYKFKGGDPSKQSNWEKI